MVRKSERTKPKAPEKPEVPEKKKPGRPSKRKKKSESDSEPEAEPDPKEVGDISESKQASGSGGPADGEKGGARRSRRHRNPSESTGTPPPASQEPDRPEARNPEWKEDPGFWGQEDSAPAPDSSATEEATTWKIQSSNGSGGEIQKLKICRQRVANESSDSTSPAQLKDSPRRKKKSKHADDNAESGGDVSSSNETKDDPKTPTEAIPMPKSDSSSAKDGAEGEAPIPLEQPKGTKETIPPEIPTEEIPIPQEGTVENSKVTEEVEVETSSRRSSQDSKDSTGKKSRKSSVEEKEDVNNKSRKSSTDEKEKSESKSRRSSTEDEPQQNEENETRSAIESIIGVQLNDNSVVPDTDEQQKEDSTKEAKPETTEEAKGGEKKILTKVKVTVNSEDAMDEIAKKLNERAARFSKDERKQRQSTESVEPKSPREEGELTPEQMRKPKHTTIIINKPKEVTSQPTRLKRTTDELPAKERKRRILLKSKSKDKDDDPINISSQSLMLLVPEVKTITPEQVAAFPLEDDELTKFELEDQSDDSSPRLSKKRHDLQPKEVEIRVENDTRQVTKKKQIVIQSSDMSSLENKSVGPKLPMTQENHRVVRKISLVSEETKKTRRSPSPSAKNQTEVLFITNLVRPFTVPQLRELLARTGTIAPNGFYIDKIKSKCYVKYTDVEMAVETRHALNGVRWPVNNPKTLKVEFVSPEEMTVVQQMADDETSTKKVESSDSGGWLSEQAALKPQRRVTTTVREWDMGKIGAGPLEEKRPVDDWRGAAKQQEQVDPKRRPASPVETKYEPTARKVKKRDNDAPARLLDDLFRKTKATPCIYWLPLTAAQIAVKEEMRRQHMAENERRLAELRKTDHSRRENRDRDHDKTRDRRKK